MITQKKATVSMSLETIIPIILALLALAAFIYYFVIAQNNVGGVDFKSAGGLSDLISIT